MNYRKKLSSCALLLGAMVLGAVLGSGCAIHRGDRSTVQPLALDKKQFTGDWYYQKTTIRAPYDAPGRTFPGSTNNGYKVRWEIGERYLYAFTTQPNVRNADSTVAPVAAWPIIGHFTVRYMLNYSTGQPSNIVGEDYRDGPWYERPHFRVAWGQSSITDYGSYDWLFSMFGMTASFTSRMGTNVRPEQVRILKDYMDFVAEEVMTPGFGSVIGKLNRGLPVSTYRIKYRYAFRKVKESTYTPRTMTDDQFQKFGYFRTAILKYSVDRGLVDWSYQYLANRHNVATKAEIDAGSNKPKQIVYYLSPTFPADMLPTAYQIIAEWNKAYQRATNRPGEDVIVLKPNDDGLPQGQKREMGDIRYRFLYWVPEAISFGLLGYGPSFADYDTGEIISSAAYVYGATVDRVVNRFMLLYDMVAGKYTDEELRNGKDYLDLINKYTQSTNANGTNQPLTMVKGHGIMRPAYKGFDIKKAINFTKSSQFAQLNTQMQNVTRTSIQSRLGMIDAHPHLKWAMIPDEFLQSQFPGVDIAQIREVDTQEGNKVLNDYLHPINLLRAGSMRKLMDDGAQFGIHTMMMANYVDPALTKFVQAHKGKSYDELKKLMRKMIFLGTEAHEIGHTLGLRHNFEASADDKNYFPRYYELIEREGGNIQGNSATGEHSWFYMYSSIMDYHGEVYGDAAGIGSYDHAAIMYGYGNLLELDQTDGQTSIDTVKEYLKQVGEAAVKDTQRKFAGIYTKIETKSFDLKTTDSKDFGGKAVKVFDVTQPLLQITGTKSDGTKVTLFNITADDVTGHQALRDLHAQFGVTPPRTRFYTDGTPFIQESVVPLRRRFYRFCSDELVGQSPYCARFDSGSNPVQMVENMIRRYDGSYPIVNWNRGRRYYRLTGGYLGRLIGQFSTVSLFFQNWMFRAINEDGFPGTQEYFQQLAAVQRGVAFVSRVLHTPEPGRHVYDANLDRYISSAKASNDVFEVPVGVGRYFYSQLQDDELGLAMYRFKRIGTMYDKYVALMVLAVRDWGIASNAVNFFYINFADYFSKDDVTDLFTEAIGGTFQKRYSFTYKDKIIKPNFHPVLQYSSMYMAMALLNNSIFGNTFTHYMTVGIEGSGSGWTPPPGQEKNTIFFENVTKTRKYFAVQTADGRSIAYKLVARGKELATKIKELRALPTSAVNQAQIQELEGQLTLLETNIQMMRLYVGVFFDG